MNALELAIARTAARKARFAPYNDVIARDFGERARMALDGARAAQQRGDAKWSSWCLTLASGFARDAWSHAVAHVQVSR